MLTERAKVTKRYAYLGHRQAVYALAEGLAADTFYSAGGDGFVAAWSHANGENLGAVLQTPKPIYALASVPEWDLLVAGQNDGGLHFAHLGEKTLVRSPQLHTQPIFGLAYLPNLQRVVAIAGDGALSLWHPATGANEGVLPLSEQPLRALALSPDGQFLAIGGTDAHIYILDAATLRRVHSWPAHSSTVFALAWHPTDPNLLLSVGRDAHLKAWQMPLATCEADIVAHTFAIHHLAFAPAGTHLATASMDKTLKLWNADTLRLVKVVDHRRNAAHTSSVNRLLWLPQQLITCSDDRQVLGWDVNFGYWD
jgi:WD repeat-containing protein 61